MAVNKKPKSKTKKPAPKKIKTKFVLKFSKVQKSLKKSFAEKKPLYIAGLVVALIITSIFLLFWFNKGLFLAGTINGRLVTSLEFYSKLSKTSGEEVFDSIVRDALINQEASKNGVSATTEEIDNKIKELEEQLGGKEALELALNQNNTSIEEVRKQLTTQILVEKLLEDEITISDKEVSDYIKQNKEFDPDISKEKAKKAIKSSKINEKFTSWFEEIKSNAKITVYF